jgi:hypothetical protein
VAGGELVGTAELGAAPAVTPMAGEPLGSPGIV